MKPKILYHNDGYFVIRMSSTTKRDKVIHSGPYMLNSQPVILKSWSEGFNFNEEVLKTVSLWVKFPNLALNYWSKDALSRIGSGIGKPLYDNDCTTNADRISYTRILVEMDVTRPIPNSVKTCDPVGNVIEQKLSYEWKPTYARNVVKLGITVRPHKGR